MSELEPKIRFFKFTKQFPQKLHKPEDEVWFHKDSICVMYPFIENYAGDGDIQKIYGIVNEGYYHTEGRIHPAALQVELLYKYEYGHEVTPEEDNFDPNDLPAYHEVIKTIKCGINSHRADIMDLELQIRNLKEFQINKNKFVNAMEKIISSKEFDLE